MSIDLQVDAGALTAQAAKLSQACAEMEKALSRIFSGWEACKGRWTGPAAARHRKSQSAIREQAEPALASLKKQPELLLRAAGIYQETEATAMETSMALRQDVIV